MVSSIHASQPGPGSSNPPWWRRSVVYQIYPRSFADGNGDGTGDIEGIRSRLGYLRELGVDALWFTPWYLSPLADGGYDVADYRQINPRFGSVDAAAELIAEANANGMRVIADVVPNHTSDQHQWFLEAVASEPGAAARSRYHIRPGQGDGSRPPNDWTSVFGGPAWTRLDDGEWYLHLFAPEQPDLNWDNPEVVAEFDEVLRFWLDQGVDGFRVDVAHGLVKDPDYIDLGDETEQILGNSRRANHPFWDRDAIHPIVRRWRAVVDSFDNERMMVAEAWVLPESYGKYLRPDEYHQVFNFDLLQAEWDASEMRNVIVTSVGKAAGVGSTPTWVLSNHDVMREATRYGLPKDTKWRVWPIVGPEEDLDLELGARRARAAALLMLALPGSAYVYQGEELGLPEVWDLPPEVLDDPVWERSSHKQKGRDGCRVPLPWTAEEQSFGFGSNGSWLPQPPWFGQYSVESQTGVSSSTLELYRAALRLRRQHCIDDEDIEMLDLGEDVLAFSRGGGLRCIVNFGPNPIGLPAHGSLILASSVEQGGVTLAADCAVWLI